VKDDALLIEEALDGDSAAFGQLVRKYQDRLFNALAHMVGCAEEAEDIAQEAFVQAYVKLESFRQDSAFYTWLYRIAFNTAVSRRRKRRIEMSIDQGRELLGQEPVGDGEAPEERLLREEQAQQVHAALSALNEEHRAILVLREMEGCCYESIAEILEVPVGTVRSRLHRARSQLREQLKEVLQGQHD
jgi:RNA polymerase sigma-70 factor (ECF subfamily)